MSVDSCFHNLIISLEVEDSISYTVYYQLILLPRGIKQQQATTEQQIRKFYISYIFESTLKAIPGLVIVIRK